jgi:transcriptional regulator of acetoin/glycerol metabolism
VWYSAGASYITALCFRRRAAEEEKAFAGGNTKRVLEKNSGIVFIHPEPNGPWVPFRPGAIFVLGRNPACAVRLEGRTVSWQHAELRCSPDDVEIRDLGSTNGLFVNGLHVREASLDVGDLIRVGGYLALVANERAMHNGAEFTHAEAIGMFVGRTLAGALAPLRAARDDQHPMVIEGETGTGKTMAARLLHAESGRPGAFVLVDGDAPGAAARLVDGAGGPGPAFAEARDGTLLLRNVDGLPVALQDRLAAALGSAASASVRCVVVTQEPLDVAVAEGRLAPGLRRRLDGVTVELPPLRRRIIEIPGLFRCTLDVLSPERPRTISPELVERLCLYDWPCNAREMVLVVQRLLSLHGDEERLRAAHLPARMQSPAMDTTTSPVTPVPRVELSRLLEAVRATRGNVGRAATSLGITRDRAYALLEGMGQQQPEGPPPDRRAVYGRGTVKR